MSLFRKMIFMGAGEHTLAEMHRAHILLEEIFGELSGLQQPDLITEEPGPPRDPATLAFLTGNLLKGLGMACDNLRWEAGDRTEGADGSG